MSLLQPSFLQKFSLENAPLKDARVLVRLDLDLPIRDSKIADSFRLKTALPTLNKIINEAREVTIIGHLGRPEGRDPKLSLRPIAEELGRLLNRPITIVDNIVKSNGVKDGWSNQNPKLTMFENIRFYPGEQQNDREFAEILSSFGDVFINESFASAHRTSASVTSLPRLLPTYLGLRFEAEVKAVLKVLDNPKRPVVVVLGGAKPDKLEFVPKLAELADAIYLGGRLPVEAKAQPKVNLAKLDQSGLDITAQSAEIIAAAIKSAQTVVWNGPVGKFEDEAHLSGTKTIAQAIAETDAFTLVGGGDTEAALEKLDLLDAPSHLSTGGGAMMELLANGNLPALEALG